MKAVSPRLVVLDGAQRINAGGVIDVRGAGDLNHLDCGWQKFTGQLMQLSEPHNLTKPIVMDATVEQFDGYRFVYVLPFGMDKIFVEDTYYSDTPAHDPRRYRQRIAEYADTKGWKVERVVREENGVLPVVMGGDLENYWASGSGRTAKAGARGGIFPGRDQLFPARRRAQCDLHCRTAGPRRRQAEHGDAPACAGALAEWQILPHAEPHAVPRCRCSGSL